MAQCFQKYCRLFTAGLSAIALITTITFSPLANAKLFDSVVAQLPVKEQVALREGRVIVSGSKGQYTGRLLVTALTPTAWEVVSDYGNFARFLPNVVSSQILETNGNRKVFEQVQLFRVFIFTKKARVRIAVTETYLQQIAFRLVQGRLRSLEGSWRLDPVSSYAGAPPNQVLLTHQVTVDPGSISSRGLFFGIYKNSLENTLKAVKQEIEKRSAKQ